MFKHMAISSRFLMFIAGGFVCAVIDIGIMQGMIFMGVNYIASATMGFFFGLIINYSFHAKLTFRTVTARASFFRFLFVVGINYFVTIVFVSLSFSLLDDALIGKIASLPVIAVNGFLLSKYWVFKC